MAQSVASNLIDWQQAGDEAVDHLRALLRLDTRNPPGNEYLAANYLRDVLEREGIACEIVGPSPDRATIVARLKGDGSAQPLLLMSHIDVVAVERDKWTHDPFGAEIDDAGYIYGRGALDMKNTVTMELMTLLLLKRSGVPLKRDVIFMAAADEEVGGYAGAGWVVANRPDLIQAEYGINEVGGVQEINGKQYQTVQTAEKGTARFRLRARGTPGHGSTPHDDNAIYKIADALLKLRDQRLPVHFTTTLRSMIEGIAAAQPPEVAQALRAIIADEATADAAIDALPDPTLRNRMRALIRNTVSPTMLHAGSQINVIPSEAEASLDGRILPGWTPERFQAELRAIIGDEIEIEFLEPSPPLEADPDSELFDLIKQVYAEQAPDLAVIPFLLGGATDAKHVFKLGTKIYGFTPGTFDGPDEGNRVHGHDERISVRSIKWGTQMMYEVVARFAGQ